MVTQSGEEEAQQRWRDISKEEYTRALSKNPTTGRIYHHLAILEMPETWHSPSENFDAIISQLFYYTKSLVVKTPFFNTRNFILTLIKPIITWNKEAEKRDSVPQTDKDHFLTAVVHLILASLEPETLRKHGFKDRRNDHVQVVYAALEKIGGSANASRICPRYVLNL